MCIVLVAAICSAIYGPVSAQAEEIEEIVEIVVVGDLGSLPDEDHQSVFGFGKSLLHTPRSVSFVTEEMMARFDMRDIDELIAVAPGSFTQSFFGVAGSLDIRGTPGETYFRGVRRLDNRGNYPTPIGASDHIDIVRGPASPVYGPSKVGGYLNFNPKSARIEETGQFISETTGMMSLGTGSWNKRILTAEIGGPGRLGSQELGYYLYVEGENSDSYYRHSGIDQTLIQASFDADLTDRMEVQFGGMYHDFSGNEIAGWNRLTQELVDHGIYLTGQPLPLDADGDGLISHQEYDVDGDGFTDLSPFVDGLVPGSLAALDPGVSGDDICSIGDTSVFGCRPELMGLVNVGQAMLDGSQSLTSPDDILLNEVVTLYFDVIVQLADNGWEWKNQLFFESYDNLNENTYGFSQLHDAWVIEDKLVVARSWRTSGAKVSVQGSPSLRFTNFEHGDDYTNEYFDRRDLTRPAGPLDQRLLATQIDDDFTEYYIGNYLNLGFAALVDVTWDKGLGVLLGLRYDTLDMESRQPVEKLLFASANNFCAPPGDSCVQPEAAGNFDGFSWSLSINYASMRGLIPYATIARQSTVIAGQGAEISTGNIISGGAFDASKLREIGLKGSLLNNSLYFAVALYEQERTDFSAQAVVTNQASQTRGAEFELRWAANEKLLLTLGYSNMEVINLNTLQAGARFSFIGAGDIPGVAPESIYGGGLAGSVVRPGRDGARRAGVPRTIGSLTATWDFGNGVAVSGSAVNVDSVYSGFSNSIRLPGYTLINTGLVVEQDKWTVTLAAKNLTDERYFRANFPNLFGGVIVLPELPRNYQVRVQYRW